MDPTDLSAWRERQALSQQEAADALGISRRTLIAYEAGESKIPLAINYACKWLDKNPALIEPRDTMKIALEDGGTARTREVALASLTLFQAYLRHLKRNDRLSGAEFLSIFNDAAGIHIDSPAGDQPWTRPTVNLIREIFYDLHPEKRSKR